MVRSFHSRLGADTTARGPHVSRCVPGALVALALAAVAWPGAAAATPTVTQFTVGVTSGASVPEVLVRGVLERDPQKWNPVLAEQRTLPALIAGAPDDVSLVTFPPGHIAGVGNMLRPLMSGGRTVFLDGWDPVRAVELGHEYRVTSTAGAPIHLQDILDLGGTGVKLPALREFLVGAAPVSEELGRRAAALSLISRMRTSP